MEAEATAELQKRHIEPTDDKFKYIWNKVIFYLCSIFSLQFQVSIVF